MRGKPLAKAVSLEVLAAETEGCSGADLAGICNKAALIAIREYLQNHPGDNKNYEGFVIGKKHVEQARALVENQRSS